MEPRRCQVANVPLLRVDVAVSAVNGIGVASSDIWQPDRQEQRVAELTVWYDGGCPLCRREMALMRRLDRRGAIEFIDIESGPASCPIDRGDLLARFHAREGAVLLSGAAAFAAMWRAIPGLRPFGLAARHRLVLALLERAYVAFLRFRPRLQSLARRLER